MTPEIGITSTPAIDPIAGIIYVVAKSRDADGRYHQRIHALGIVDGTVRGSAEIEATVTASGASVTFDPRLQLNRPGLLLLNGVVYVAFGSHCDFGAYHGWVFGYDGLTLGRAFVVTPTGGQ